MLRVVLWVFDTSKAVHDIQGEENISKHLRDFIFQTVSSELLRCTQSLVESVFFIIHKPQKE